MALHIAATGTSILAELAQIAAPARELGQRWFAAIGARIQDLLDPYRPELHYMRGPGPRGVALLPVTVRAGTIWALRPETGQLERPSLVCKQRRQGRI
jgi:hypothetical protein